MEIQDIKTRLTMANVIHYYGLKASLVLFQLWRQNPSAIPKFRKNI